MLSKVIGIPMMEDLLDTIRAILKTLECSICLDLIKTPVSIGCGHFFCRQCALGVLNSNYRAPCPLCKKSFTRRSVQEATQRQAVITASKALVERCENLTGLNLFLKENSERENSSRSDVPLNSSIQQKSVDTQGNVQSKKRKCENSYDGCDAVKLSSDAASKEIPYKRASSSSKNTINSNVESSSLNKRPCPSTVESDEDEELPDLEDLLAYPEKYRDKSDLPTEKMEVHIQKQHKETPLSIKLPEKRLPIKTYSKHYLKLNDSKRKKAEDVFDFIAADPSGTNTCDKNLKENLKENSITTHNSAENTNLCCFNTSLEVDNESEKETKRSDNIIMQRLKNKRNALKNKTNKVSSSEFIMSEDCFLRKTSDGVKGSKKINEKQNVEKSDIYKENEKNDISETKGHEKKISDSDSFYKSKCINSNKKTKGKTRKRNTKFDTLASSSSADEESNFKTRDFGNQKISREEKVLRKTLSKCNEGEKECYNLNEIIIANKDVTHNNAKDIKCNYVEEALKSGDSTDTAVSVHSVASPPANKLLSLKSPGWSRVKQVGKDFKVKTFSTLLIEKNHSGNTSKNKNDVFSDTIVHNEASEETDGKVKFIQLSPVVGTDNTENKSVGLSNSIENQDIEDVSMLSEHEITNSNIPNNTKFPEKENLIEIVHYKCANENVMENVAFDKALHMEIASVNEELLENSLTCTQNEALVTSLLELEKSQSQNCEGKFPQNEILVASSDSQKKNANSVYESLFINDKTVKNSHEINKSIEEDSVEQHNLHMSEAIQKEYNIKKNKNDESCTVITVQVENPRLKQVNIGLNYEDKAVDISPEQINVNDPTETIPFEGKHKTVSDKNNSDQMSYSCPVTHQNIVSKRLNEKQKYLRKSDSNLIIHSNTLNKSSTKNAHIMTSQKYIEFRNIDEKNKKRMYHFHSSELRKQSELSSNFGKISECKITTTESVANKEENEICYVEHSQQTSQNLSGYYDKTTDSKKFGCGQAPILKCPVKQFLNEAQKDNEISDDTSVSCLNERSKEHFDMSVLNSGKTKVLKRTCLTLEEIQDCFLKSNKCGQTEIICSLPFLAGQFQLDICVSEETLNISVLKTLNSKVENGVHISDNNVGVKEKCVQTSSFNSPAHSPRVLPSSNAESESSLPDLCNFVNTVGNNNDRFPFLKCSLSTIPQPSKVSLEVPNENATRCVPPEDGTPKLLSCEHAQSPSISVPNEAIPKDICEDNLAKIDNTANTSAVIHYPKLESENCEQIRQSHDVENFLATREPATISYAINDKHSTILSNESCLEKYKVNSENKLHNSSSHTKNLNASLMELSSEEDNPFNGNASVYQSTPVKLSVYKHINEDSEGFSSDPDMAFANELVAPLKNIAEQMDCSRVERQKRDKVQKKAYPFVVNCRDKLNKSPEICNHEKFVQIIDSCKNKVVRQKPSKLSLKTKKNCNKFKRIQTRESSDDSDSQEMGIKVKSDDNKITDAEKETLSEMPISNISHANSLPSCSARILNQVPEKINDNIKGDKKDTQSEVCESEDPNTFNSNFSDDIPNVNASEIIMEIEDLDKKIKSLEEKLKHCGNAEPAQPENFEKSLNSSRLQENNSSYVNLEDSEDSTDLFPLTVPPTPPNGVLHSDTKSFYKCF